MIDWATYHVPAPSVIAQIYRYSETRLNHAPFQVCVRARAYARVCEGERERKTNRIIRCFENNHRLYRFIEKETTVANVQIGKFN